MSDTATASRDAPATAERSGHQRILALDGLRGIAVVVDAAQPAGPMLESIRRAGQPLLKDVTVFDVYEGENVGAKQKSVAFGLSLGAERTLRDKDVDKTVSKVLKALESDFNAKLR